MLLLQPEDLTPQGSDISRAANKSRAQQSIDQLTLYPSQSLSSISTCQPTHMQRPCQCSSARGRGKVRVDTWLNTSFQHQAEPPTAPLPSGEQRESCFTSLPGAGKNIVSSSCIHTYKRKKYCQEQGVQTIATTINLGCEKPALR